MARVEALSMIAQQQAGHYPASAAAAPDQARVAQVLDGWLTTASFFHYSRGCKARISQTDRTGSPSSRKLVRCGQRAAARLTRIVDEVAGKTAANLSEGVEFNAGQAAAQHTTG